MQTTDQVALAPKDISTGRPLHLSSGQLLWDSVFCIRQGSGTHTISTMRLAQGHGSTDGPIPRWRAVGKWELRMEESVFSRDENPGTQPNLKWWALNTWAPLNGLSKVCVCEWDIRDNEFASYYSSSLYHNSSEKTKSGDYFTCG